MDFDFVINNLYQSYFDTKIKDDEFFYRLSFFNKNKYDFLMKAKKFAEKTNHTILKKRINNAWQFGDWQLVAETVKDINLNSK